MVKFVDVFVFEDNVWVVIFKLLMGGFEMVCNGVFVVGSECVVMFDVFVSLGGVEWVFEVCWKVIGCMLIDFVLSYKYLDYVGGLKVFVEFEV